MSIPASRSKKILIVDDNALFREGLSNLLNTQSDYCVVGAASNVAQAIEQAYLLRPDIILIDFGLADGIGLDTTQEIMAELPECKIVFLTAFEAEEKLLAAIRSGAKGYLLKNLPASKLIASLKAVERGEVAISRALTSRVLEEFARAYQSNEGGGIGISRLSAREKEILCELAAGATNKEIAKNLFISENTVKHHLHSLLAKLGLSTRTEAADYARRHGVKPALPP